MPLINSTSVPLQRVSSDAGELNRATASIDPIGDLTHSFWKGELKPTPAERIMISRDIKDAHAILHPKVDLVVVRNFWNIDVDATAQEFLKKNPYTDWLGTDLSVLRTHMVNAFRITGL